MDTNNKYFNCSPQKLSVKFRLERRRLASLGHFGAIATTAKRAAPVVPAKTIMAGTVRAEQYFLAVVSDQNRGLRKFSP